VSHVLGAVGMDEFTRILWSERPDEVLFRGKEVMLSVCLGSPCPSCRLTQRLSCLSLDAQVKDAEDFESFRFVGETA